MDHLDDNGMLAKVRKNVLSLDINVYPSFL